MAKLTDYTKMKPKEFWALVKKEGESAKNTFDQLWEKVGEDPLTQEEAVECLDALFIYSHSRIQKHSPKLAKNYPTKQLTKNRLANQDHLWWVDHFTAGISKWSTLSWFSAAKTHKKKSGKLGYAGASTHFIQGYHGAPFYIIPLMHGAWHEPKRNRDSLSIEFVNAGALHRNKKTSRWAYWARDLPQELVEELPPVSLGEPYRGLRVMQPFTREQIINGIKLKRVILAALPDRLDPDRMSQHSDWKKGKTDMGPLWPYEDCNSAAFILDPIEELQFVQTYDDFLASEGKQWDEDSKSWEEHKENANPSYGDGASNHDDDPNDDPEDFHLTTLELQERLIAKGYSIIADGIPGKKTRTALLQFQQTWNRNNPKDLIKADGIPGPQTCERLLK